MTQLIIDIGDAPNDGTGDPARDAFNKCNNNFTELYTTGSGSGGGGFTASSTPPGSPVAGDHWYDLSTGILAIYINDGTSSQWVTVSAGGYGSVMPGPPQGRLTLQTATPVMITTQAAKTTIYYSPYCGNMLPLYDGTSMIMTTFAELSVATTDTTKSPAAIGASKVNDWFVWSDAGTVRLGHGPDWTNDTTRSAGTALVMVNGIWLNNAAITNGPAASRGTYVGTTCSNGSSQLDWIPNPTPAAGGNPAILNVWNAYNRVLITATESDSTSSWSYAGGVRNSNNSTNNSIRWVDGLAESWVASSFGQTADAGTGCVAVQDFQLSAGTMRSTKGYNNTGVDISSIAMANILPSLGYRVLQAREENAGANAGTFYGGSFYMFVITLVM